MWPCLPPHSRVAVSATVLRMLVRSSPERLTILSTSLAAVCCSSASARRFSRSRTWAPSSLDDLRPIGGLASLDLAGFGPWRIGLPLPPYDSARDTLPPTRPPGQR